MRQKRHRKRPRQPDAKLLARVVQFIEGPPATLDAETRALLDAVVTTGRRGWLVMPARADHAALRGRGQAPTGWPQDVQAMQAQIADSFRAIMAFEETGSAEIVPWRPALEYGFVPVGRHVLQTVQGPLADLVQFQVRGLLADVGSTRLRRCHCGRLYIRTGRRENCSPTCQKRSYRRGQRENERKGSRHGKTTRAR